MIGLSLFTGAGGADLGIAEAGIEIVRGVEHDEDAVATCHAAGLDYVRHGDVRELAHYEGLPPIDLLFGGPPCQAFSTAGKRRGQDDLDRNGWPWTLEVIDHVRPRWVLLENVPGLLHHSTDCAPPCPGCYWTGDLWPAFRARYPFVEHRILNASSYGVPQHRRRVLLVCGPGPIRWPQATHGDPATFGQADLFGRRLEPWATVSEALLLRGSLRQGVINKDNYGKETQTGRPAPTLLIGSPVRFTPTQRLTDEPACALRGAAGGSTQPFAIFGGGTRGRGMAEWRPRDCTHTPAPTVNAMQGSTAAIYSAVTAQEVKGTRASMVGSGLKGSTREATKPAPTLRDDNGTAGLYLERPSPAVLASEVKGARHQDFDPDRTPMRASDALWRATGRRRLTVEECARLQDFPPGHPFQGTKTAQYRQVGNAWPRAFGRVLGRAIREAAGAPATLPAGGSDV